MALSSMDVLDMACSTVVVGGPRPLEGRGVVEARGVDAPELRGEEGSERLGGEEEGRGGGPPADRRKLMVFVVRADVGRLFKTAWVMGLRFDAWAEAGLRGMAERAVLAWKAPSSSGLQSGI